MRTRQLNEIHHLTVLAIALGATSRLELRRLPSVRGMINASATATAPQSGVSDGTLLDAFLSISLDAIWSDIEAATKGAVHGIKIDVQGHELDVLLGMTDVLLAFRPLLVLEFHTGVDRTAIIEHLRRCGYQHPGLPIEAGPNETDPLYTSNRSYVFAPS